MRQEVTVEESPTPITFSAQETSGLVTEKQVKDLSASVTLAPTAGVITYCSGDRC